MVLTFHAGSRGFDSHRGHMSERFSDPVDQDIPQPVSSELESDWQSLIAVSLNVGGGVRLIKLAKLYMCTQNTTNTDGRTAPGVCSNGSVPLSHSGNVFTRIGTHIHTV